MPATPKQKARSVMEAHQHLQATFRSLIEMANRWQQGRPDDERLRRDCRDLAVTRSTLLEHFLAEEGDGLHGNIREDSPRHAAAVRRLLEEHREIDAELDAVYRDALGALNEPGVSMVEFGQRLVLTHEKLRQHEARENALLQEVFMLDLGAQGAA